jgi:hypothetical protein
MVLRAVSSSAAGGGVTSVSGTANEITSTGTTSVVLSLPTALTFTGKTVTGGTFSGPTIAGPDAPADITMVGGTGLWGGGRGFWWEAGVLGAPATGGWVDFDGTNNRWNVVSTGAHVFYNGSGSTELFRANANGLQLTSLRVTVQTITDANNQGFRVSGSGSSYLYNISASSDSFNLNQYNGSAWTTRVSMDTAGTLTIGASTEITTTRDLRINPTSGTPVLRFQENGTLDGLITASSTTMSFETQGTRPHVWNIGGAEYMRLATTGLSFNNACTITSGTNSSGNMATIIDGDNSSTAITFKLSGDTASQLGGITWNNNSGTTTANMWMTGDASAGVWRFQLAGTGTFDFINNTVAIAANTPSFRVTGVASGNRHVTVTASNGGNPAISASGGDLAISSAIVLSQTTLLKTSVALTNGAAANTGTLTNSPAAGNPTKWIPIDDNGTTRYIPAW